MPAVGALERLGPAPEGPGDHPAHRVFAGHRRPHGAAAGVQLVRRDHVDVGGDLQHRVHRRVDDEVAGAQVLGAEALDRLDAVRGLVAQHPAAGELAHPVDHVRGKPLRIGGQRRRRHHSHELPVAGGRVLAGAQRTQPPVHDRRGRRRHAAQREDRAQSQPAQDREVQPAHDLGQVPERVGAGVAVGVRVGQRAGAAGVEHHDHRPAATATRAIRHPGAHEAGVVPGAPIRSERSSGANTARSTRPNSPGGA